MGACIARGIPVRRTGAFRTSMAAARRRSRKHERDDRRRPLLAAASRCAGSRIPHWSRAGQFTDDLAAGAAAPRASALADAARTAAHVNTTAVSRCRPAMRHRGARRTRRRGRPGDAQRGDVFLRPGGQPGPRAHASCSVDTARFVGEAVAAVVTRQPPPMPRGDPGGLRRPAGRHRPAGRDAPRCRCCATPRPTTSPPR